ncbi:MAG: superoxide dismutase [Woeseiaceae bacterium]|nr:superoxide dismutase [Woeseiaceae bacterium]
MAFSLMDLPYARDDLAPHMSENTLNYHYGKHHQGYVNKLNGMAEGTKYASMSLEDVVRAASEADDSGVYNNAAQVLNHDFLWHSLSPDGGGAPSGDVKDAIEESFGGVDQFREAFTKAATSQFGSGWAWLVADKGKLEVLSTGNADNPMLDGKTPLITLDVWEHAYYLDYQNDRREFVDTFLDHLVNWKFANRNLASA